MRIGEWNDLGPVRGLLQRQLGDLGATEYASHVTLNPDTGRVRILVATDAGLLDYTFAPSGSDPEAAWLLRGEVYRWPRVRGLRLQLEAQIEDARAEAPTVWHLIAEDPKIELSAHSGGTDDHDPHALLPLARACIQHAG